MRIHKKLSIKIEQARNKSSLGSIPSLATEFELNFNFIQRHENQLKINEKLTKKEPKFSVPINRFVALNKTLRKN